MQGMQGMQNIHQVPQSSAQQPQSTIHVPGAPLQTQVITSAQMQPPNSNNAQVQMTQVPANCQNVSVGAIGGIQQGNMTFHQTDQEQDSISGIQVGPGSQPTDAVLLESLGEVAQNADEQQTIEDSERYG